MKLKSILLFVFVFLLMNNSIIAQNYQPKTYEDTVFYSIGVLVSERFFTKEFYADFNTDELMRGLKATRIEKGGLPSMEEMKAYVKEYNSMIQENPNMSFSEGMIDTSSYYFGMLVGLQFFPFKYYKVFGYTAFKNAVIDTRNGNPLFEQNAVMATVQKYNQKIQEEANAKSIKEGRAFLAENAKKEGVITTASGLQYKVIKEGTGTAFPTPQDTVKTNYKGYLIDGEVFDENQGIEFPLSMVIPGWTEGIQLMTTGSKFEFYIPYQLGYGERGQGAAIPPYTVLIFEVELLEINGQK